jgi:hypothetical protein
VAASAWEAKWEILLPFVALAAVFGGFTSLIEASALTRQRREKNGTVCAVARGVEEFQYWSNLHHGAAVPSNGRCFTCTSRR